ncbi:unnamed protein product, partial [Rotaria sp. Silwood2]
VIELSMGSNGWFRYFANNSLSTMYSSGSYIYIYLFSFFSFVFILNNSFFVGSPETNIDTDENRHEFIEKFQRLKQQVLDGIGQEKDTEKQNMIIARTIFTSDTSNERIITIGNWTIQCNGPTQIQIHNIEGEQVRLNEEKKKQGFYSKLHKLMDKSLHPI